MKKYPKNNKIVSSKNEKNGGQIQSQSVMMSMSYSGPIPPASELLNYENALPGAANRILKMAEKQSDHRREMEEKALDANIQTQKRGQLFGFIVFIITIITGALLLLLERSVEGLALLIGSVVTIVSLFITGKIIDKKELKNKDANISQNKTP